MDNVVYFNRANMTVNDWWVVVGDKQYEMSTLTNAAVVTKRFPGVWREFAKTYFFVLVLDTTIVLIANLFGLKLGGIYVFWILDVIFNAFKTKEKSAQYTLVVRTPTDYIEAATLSDGTYLHIIAKEINSRILKDAPPPQPQVGAPPMQDEMHFPKANVTLSGAQVAAGSDLYQLADVSYAEVVTKRYPVRWRDVIETYAILFLLLAVVWAIASFMGWIDLGGPVFAVGALLLLAIVVYGQIKQAYRHTLTLETRSGTVDVATSQDDSALLQACEAINRAIKRRSRAQKNQRSDAPIQWIHAR